MLHLLRSILFRREAFTPSYTIMPRELSYINELQSGICKISHNLSNILMGSCKLHLLLLCFHECQVYQQYSGFGFILRGILGLPGDDEADGGAAGFIAFLFPGGKG